MSFEIERVADASRAGDWHRIGVAVLAHDAPDLLADPVEEVIAQLPDGSPSFRREFYVGYADGEPVARGEIGLPTLDNLRIANLSIQVTPSHRRRGYGRQIFEHLRERAVAVGRSILMGEVTVPLVGEAPGESFATRFGAKEALRDIRRVLELKAVDNERLDALEAEARRHSGGYELVEWTGHAPGEFVEDAARLMARMVTDSPMGELHWGEEHWDGERLSERIDEFIRRGRTVFAVGARSSSEHSLVAMTEIGVSRRQPEVGYQWDTIVAPEHRGHRLGLLVKVANLRRVLAETPTTERLVTWNAESNVHMISVNERLGFQVVGAAAEWQLELT